MATIVIICGIYCLAFAVFHLWFWRLFSWKTELLKLSFPNRAIMQILNTRLIYVFLLFALLCFCFPQELCTTPMGHLLLGGMSVFWMGRTIEQFVFLRRNHPYIHLLTLVFAAGAVLFLIPVLC
ncbi:hypothetical protein C7T94_14715 [Pedobacter yulinensis]|uniref:DUF4181 domain-containing protein n=1 Tax=Pedobacter yulinensis TaxID=2126353 RepID=A0A2T3HI52_9SPHI|nr:hypothetical protein C7T94_14715 [Pedobacter yulinensis]